MRSRPLPPVALGAAILLGAFTLAGCAGDQRSRAPVEDVFAPSVPSEGQARPVPGDTESTLTAPVSKVVKLEQSLGVLCAIPVPDRN